MTFETNKKSRKISANFQLEDINKESHQAQYEGGMLDELRHGKGILKWSNGDTYRGIFWKGMRHGIGEFRSKKRNGVEMYNGEWKESKMHGHGVKEWPSGNRYEGTWKGGFMDGCGKLKTHGGTYAGEFCDGKKNGFGFMTLNKGDTYEGQFENGRFSGWGEYIYEDGRQYQGEWSDGLRHGVGVFAYENEEQYDGEWKEGKRHGKGIYRWANGETRQGIWNQDVLKKWTGPKHVFGTSDRIGKERPNEFDDKIKAMPQLRELKEGVMYRKAFEFSRDLSKD